MSIVRFGLMVLVMAVLLADRSTAQEDNPAQPALEDPQSLLYGRDGQGAPFQSNSARQMMSKDDYEIYKLALAEFDCENANWVLNWAFIRQYPQYERARLKPKCRSDPDCRQWEKYARVHFDGYGHCTTIVRLNKVERELRQSNMTPPEFRWKGRRQPTVYNNVLLENRDSVLALLISIAENNYPPSLIKLAALVRRGGVFSADEEIEYYILRRACYFGDECAAIAPRLAELRRGIAPNRITVIEKKVRASGNSRPILRSILLGNKL